MGKPQGAQVLEVRRLIGDANLVIEVRDARGPSITSAERYLGTVRVPRLVVLSKSDLADHGVTEQWVRHPPEGVEQVLALDLSGRSRAGQKFLGTLESYLGRVKTALGIIRAVVVGLPNVGKSTLINRLKKATAARVGDQPGVTRGKLWVQISPRCFVLDTPGIIQISATLLRRAGDQAWKLSLLNIVPETAMEPEETVLGLIEHLRNHPSSIEDPAIRQLVEGEKSALDVLLGFTKAQRLVTRGGTQDVITASRRLIGRFRRLEIGHISLDEPPRVDRPSTL